MRQSHHFRFLFVYANLPNCGLVHMIRPELIVSRCYCTLLRSKVQIVQYRLASDASYVLADSEAPLSAVTAASWQPRRELVLGRMFISSTTAVREFRPGKRDSRVCAPTQDHSQILLGCLSST